MSAVGRFQLQVEYWFVSHKQEFRKLRNILFIVVDAALLLYVLVSAILYLVFTPRVFSDMQAMAVETVDYQALHRSIQPSAVSVSQVSTVRSSDSTVDALANLSNGNPQWVVEKLTYQFVVDGEPLEPRDVMLVGDERRYIGQYGIPYSEVSSVPRVEFNILETAYKHASTFERIPAVTVGFEDISYEEPVITANQLGMRVRALVRNEGVFGYRVATIQCVLLNAGSPVAIAEVAMRDLKSLERTPVEFTWLTNLELSDISLTAHVNVLDDFSFLPVEVYAPEDDASDAETR